MKTLQAVKVVVVAMMVAMMCVGCLSMLCGHKVATAPFDPTKFIGGGQWSYWKGPINGDGLSGEEERDKASLALTGVNFAKTEFVTCLKTNEDHITGEEKLARLKNSGHIIYGATVFQGLWQDYQIRKGNSALERLYKEREVTTIYFFGDVLRHPNGHRFVLCLSRSNDIWIWNYRWLNLDWAAKHPTVVSRRL